MKIGNLFFVQNLIIKLRNELEILDSDLVWRMQSMIIKG